LALEFGRPGAAEGAEVVIPPLPEAEPEEQAKAAAVATWPR
jgi:hypothetical protein